MGIVKEGFGWKFLKKIGLLEIWQTPTKYLVCMRYDQHFHFFPSYEEAIKFTNEILKQYEKGLFVNG